MRTVCIEGWCEDGKVSNKSEKSMPDADCIQFYILESYLFTTVYRHFAEQGHLAAFDYFCIVIWKANGAKTKLAKRLLGNSTNTLDEVVTELTRAIAAQNTARDRLRLLKFGDIRLSSQPRRSCPAGRQGGCRSRHTGWKRHRRSNKADSGRATSRSCRHCLDEAPDNRLRFDEDFTGEG